MLAYQWTDGDLMPKELVDVFSEELSYDEDEVFRKRRRSRDCQLY